jgi:hypothetical protein
VRHVGKKLPELVAFSGQPLPRSAGGITMSTDEVTEQAFGRVGVGKREGLTLRQAGLVVAFSMLIMTAVTPFAEFRIFHKLVLSGNIEQTVQNIVFPAPKATGGPL